MSALRTRHYFKEPIAHNSVVQAKKQRFKACYVLYDLSLLKCKIKLLFSKLILGFVDISFIVIKNKQNQNLVLVN